jgi:hypothetical protein
MAADAIPALTAAELGLTDQRSQQGGRVERAIAGEHTNVKNAASTAGEPGLGSVERDTALLSRAGRGEGPHVPLPADARAAAPHSAVTSNAADFTRTAGRERSGRRADKPAAAEPHDGDEPADRFMSRRRVPEAAGVRHAQDTVVNVTIGRIEVRAPAAPVRAKPAPDDARKTVSAGAQLADYLRSRNQARR